MRVSAPEETPDFDDVQSVFDNSEVISPALMSHVLKRKPCSSETESIWIRNNPSCRFLRRLK